MQKARIAVGEPVQWSSQAAGRTKKKVGVVIAFVPHFASARARVPALQEAVKSRVKFATDSSAADRYVVEVRRAKGNGSDFYAPLAGVVEKQNADARRADATA